MKFWMGLLLLIAATTSHGLALEDLLGPDAAFPVRAERFSANQVRLTFDIAEGYALYRAKLRVVGLEGFVVDQVTMPPGERIEDPDLGVMELYRGRVDVVVSGRAPGEQPVQLQVTTQGCADAGVCFNPVTRVVSAGESDSRG